MSPARAFHGVLPLEKRRGLAPYTTSSLTPRHPPGHASAFAGQLAWWPVGSRSLSPRPVKGATSHDPRCLPPLHSPRSPAEAPPPSLATNGEVVCHELAARERLSAFERQRRNESEVCNLNYDARARPTELLTLSRAGAVARFALRRKVSPPPGEPRRSTSPSGTCLATRHLPLRVTARFGIAPALAFATSPRRTCLRCDALGKIPNCAAFVDGAHHFLTTRRLSTTRRPIMASDVGRGLRAAAW